MLGMYYSIEGLSKNANEGHHFILAKQNDISLGFASYINNYNNQQITRIPKIYILPEAQGTGIGKKLLEEIERLAKENHSEKLNLNVNRWNKAQDFYKKMGFEIVGEEDIPIGHDYLMQDYIMEKTL